MTMILAIALCCGLVTATPERPTPPGVEPTPLRAPAAAGEAAIETASGRIFTGEIDRRTDEAAIWLRRGSAAAAVLRPIGWDRVVRARVAGQDLSREQLLDMVREVRKELPAPESVAGGTKRIVIRGSDRARAPATRAAEARPARESPLVRWLTIEAAPARWGPCVDADGLAVRVCPRGDNGDIAAVRGTIEVTLIAEQTSGLRPEAAFCTLGHWEQAVGPSDFGPSGAVYRFPFQAVYPEQHTSVATWGAVHVRLSVPGQGTFEATSGMVRLRPYSAVRDVLQLDAGRRFFPQEWTQAAGR